MALMTLVTFASIVFTLVWTSVHNHASSSSVSKPQTKTTTTTSFASSFESLVKENFARSSQKVPKKTVAVLRKSNIPPNNKPKKNDVSIPNNNNNHDNNQMMPHIWVIYFPQYHPDPLNDQNWGVNFTDWVSLQKSPLQNREGYDIPRPLLHLDGVDDYYYDLRDVAPRQRHGQLARQYGVDGFIYHHYWFYDPTHPGPNLAAPLLNMLQDGHPNVPFFFNWCGA
jgi:Glycosyltransferase WbsX